MLQYQIDRLIHEDAGRADSSNPYETQARAVRRNYLFFDAWMLLLSLVHGKFSWAAGSVVILLNGFTLHYLPGRPRVMDEVQGSNKKKRKKERKKHLHPHDKVFHKGGAGFFEWRPSFPHMVLINSWGPDFLKYGQHEVSKDFYLGITTPIKKKSHSSAKPVSWKLCLYVAKLFSQWCNHTAAWIMFTRNVDGGHTECRTNPNPNSRHWVCILGPICR